MPKGYKAVGEVLMFFLEVKVEFLYHVYVDQTQDLLVTRTKRMPKGYKAVGEVLNVLFRSKIRVFVEL